MKKKIQIKLNDSESTTYDKIISFWEERGFTFTEKNENQLIGERGSILQNLVTFNMQKVDTKIWIDLSDNDVNVTLHINTRFQIITSVNERFWELELQTFKSVLLNNDYREDDWTHFNKQQKKSNIIWVSLFVLSGVIFGTIGNILFA